MHDADMGASGVTEHPGVGAGKSGLDTEQRRPGDGVGLRLAMGVLLRIGCCVGTISGVPCPLLLNPEDHFAASVVVFVFVGYALVQRMARRRSAVVVVAVHPITLPPGRRP